MIESVFRFFPNGACRLCSLPVRGTANKNRHLRRHAGDGLVREVKRSEWEQLVEVVDLMKNLQGWLDGERQPQDRG